MAERNLVAVPNASPTVVTENDWSEARKKFVLDNYCNNAPDAVALVFMGEAMRRGLSPEAKQIYLIPRGKGDNRRWITQTSIDGYRVIADRTRRYAGSDDAAFSYDAKGALEKAVVTVWKMVEGQRCSFSASARWNEYTAGENLWLTKPHVMLSKCAESLALRKAFPAELSGLYTDAEMDQAGGVDVRSSVSIAPDSPRQVDRGDFSGGVVNLPSPDQHDQPAAEDEDQPCAIDNCIGFCNAEWVAFSHRKYGHPLCNKHSAMAKRGELDGPLARLNEPKPAPVVEAAASVAKADPHKDAMTTLFAEAKRHGLSFDLLELYAQETLGASTADMTLSAIVQLTQKLKREDKDALLDRLTNRPERDDSDGVATDMFPDVEFAQEPGNDRYTSN